MKKYSALLILTVLGGAAAFVLRLMEMRTEFDAETGLAASGNLYALLLPLLLAALTVVIFLLTRKLPAESGETVLPFQSYFSCTGAGIPTILVMGIFLWLLSGAYGIYTGLAVSASVLSILIGVLTILTACCLLPVVSVSRRGGVRAKNGTGGGSALNSNLLLAPVGYLVFRLVLTYREASINPALTSYYVELLALSALILTFFRASSFAFHCGRTRRFAMYAGLSVILCMAVLAEGHTPAELLMYAGGALLSLGLLCLRLAGVSGRKEKTEEHDETEA
jgi:hypothetical protein